MVAGQALDASGQLELEQRGHDQMGWRSGLGDEVIDRNRGGADPGEQTLAQRQLRTPARRDPA